MECMFLEGAFLYCCESKRTISRWTRERARGGREACRAAADDGGIV